MRKLIVVLKPLLLISGLVIIGLLDGWYDSLGVFLCLFGYSMELPRESLKLSINDTGNL